MNRAQLILGNTTIVTLEGVHLYVKDFIVETISAHKLIVSETDVLDWAQGWMEKYSKGEVTLYFHLDDE